MSNMMAANGAIYICGACGKTSRYRYGFDAHGRRDCSPGWDESCVMNSALCREDSIERDESGRIANARAVANVDLIAHEVPVLPGSISPWLPGEEGGK